MLNIAIIGTGEWARNLVRVLEAVQESLHKRGKQVRIKKKRVIRVTSFIPPFL